MPGPLPRLHGRDDEIAVLRQALDRTTSGRQALVLVEGEAGIGKTRLLSAMLEVARDEGAQVVAGRAEEQERTRPFGLWAEMLRCTPSAKDAGRARIASLLAPRQHMAPPITVTSDPGLQFQVVDALVDLVEELAHEAPLVIGLDDLHWADPSSLLTTAAVARRLTQAPVAIIACFRSAPRTPELGRTLTNLDAAGARTVHLGALSDQAVRDLAIDVLAAAPGERLLATVAGSGGNPLFATELLAALVGEGAVETVDGRAEVVRPVLPPSLRMTILRHLSFLPMETLEILRPASILGTSFTIGDLSTTTARTVLDLADALRAAIVAAVVIDDGQRLRFRHDLIRDALYFDIPPSVRLALHREAGQQLARAAAPALQVAEHLARGATRGDPEAIGWLTRAAREAAPTSPDVAAHLLRQAIDLTDPGDRRRDVLVAERATSLWWAGHVIDAQAACQELLGRDHDPQVEEQVRLCLARTLIAEGRMADGLAELGRVEQIPALIAASRAAAWGWASMAHGSIGDLDAAEDAASRARSEAPADAHVPISLAMNSLAAVAEHRGQPDRALRLIDDAVAVADRSPERVGHRYPVHATRGHILMELDRLDDARSTLQTGRRICEALGSRWALPSFEAFLGVERFLSGDWDDAIAGLEASIDLAAETGEHYSLVQVYSVLGLIALHRGELRRAAELVALAEQDLNRRGPRFRSHWAAWVRGLLHEVDGDVPAAFASLRDCWDDCVRRGFAIEFPVLGPDLVRLALGVGDRERAEHVAATVADLSAQEVPSRAAAGLRCRGLLAGEPEPLVAAVEAMARSGRRMERALTLEDAAGVLARTGSSAQAGRYYEHASDLFEALDAARDVARVEASMRRLGVRRGIRGRRARPRTGWASLTPTEHRVVDLVVEGLTNPQIGERLYLSRRTVQTHVAHVFAKVDVSSRAQLAAVATRQRAEAGTPEPSPDLDRTASWKPATWRMSWPADESTPGRNHPDGSES